MRKLIFAVCVLKFSSAFAVVAPSPEKAQRALDSLYTEQFSRLSISGEPVFSKENENEDIKEFFLKLHKKTKNYGRAKGHSSYAINTFPDACKEVLESGHQLPNDYKSEIYPKNRPAFPKVSFYKIVKQCNKLLKKNESLLSSYNDSINQFIDELSREKERNEREREIKESAKAEEQKDPNYVRYNDTQNDLEKLSKSRVFEFVCQQENPYNDELIRLCVYAEHESLNLIISSLTSLWKDSNGRKNMNEILNILDSDLEKSMKLVNGKAVPDMALTRIRFRESLKNYFKTKGFSVYDAVAVLN